MRIAGNKQIKLYRLVWMSWFVLFSAIIAISLIVRAVSLNTVKQQVKKSIESNLYIRALSLEESLEMITAFVYNAYFNEAEGGISRLADKYVNGSKPFDQLNAAVNLKKTLQAIEAWSNKIAFQIIYLDDTTNPLWIEVGDSGTFPDRLKLKADFERRLTSGNLDDLSSSATIYFKGEAEGYLVKVMKLANCYFIIGISEDEILRTLRDKMPDAADQVFFAADENRKILFASEALPIADLPGNDGETVYLKNQPYLQSQIFSKPFGISFGVLTNQEKFQRETQRLFTTFSVVLLVLMLLAPISILFFRKSAIQPLATLVSAMKTVEEGDLEIEVNHPSQIYEFQQLTNSFNQMIRRIRKLRIEKYEAELKAQKATLQYLQLQINPHFYANALNTIYALTEIKDYQSIQKLAAAIAAYSRYHFRDATELVDLTRELDHVLNYAAIQAIRFPDQIQVDLEIPSELRSALLPPFVIQSFVENCVKYAMRPDRILWIKIRAEKDETSDQLILQISDNGAGFPAEMTKASWEKRLKKTAIGIRNVLERLRMVYDSRTEVLLSNDGGAVVRVSLPFISMDDAEADADFQKDA